MIRVSRVKQAISLRLESDIIDKIEALAKAENKKRSEFMADLLTKLLLGEVTEEDIVPTGIIILCPERGEYLFAVSDKRKECYVDLSVCKTCPRRETNWNTNPPTQKCESLADYESYKRVEAFFRPKNKRR